jgi:RNA polymerase sigma factor (sigma-70 family)
MPDTSSSPLLRYLRGIVVGHGMRELTDGQLLERFVSARDEAAFAALIHRHGPMVLRVCQRVLGNSSDAEDTFQATFLMLARKADRIGNPGSTASWLHGVAFRLASKVRVAAARRQRREKKAATMPAYEPSDDSLWRDLQPVLDQEICRLPERYRQPFVLCYLEGKTNEEAAALLGWPRGTVHSSLARARERLRRRLNQRGITVATGLLPAVLAGKAGPAAVPTVLAAATLESCLSASAPAGLAAIGIWASLTGLTKTGGLPGLIAAALILSVVGATVYWIAGHGLGTKESAGSTISDGLAVKGDAFEPPAGKSPPVRRDADGIQGVWFDEANNCRLICEGQEFALQVTRDEIARYIPRLGLRGTFRLAQSKAPPEIDFVGTPWDLQGIYRLEGDVLTLCLSNRESRQRPQEFATSGRQNTLLLAFKRQPRQN